MGGVFKNMNALKKALKAKMYEALEETTENSLADAQMNTKAFYAGSTPKFYKRTYKYGNSPTIDGIEDMGDVLFSSVYLDNGYKYNTGTYSAKKVFEEAEIRGSGIIGVPGTWAETKKDVQQNIQESFGKRFH